ncbi:putative pentatricopeptide repeat-containing protein [Prunus yedoensis var. nudiflora]|uniref:Putative pentatricopeptide repeat-containing protein n=1 Tax=Prunus yedoensis var. nudiflora TaxID=2094558 RepID=A0A314XMU3_PRUYE|nr:putative pentatricopeptide repeat-containing protein [Prunus yedoensis var. nudiflora]
MVDVIGKARNIQLFWDMLHEMGRRRLLNDNTFLIALKTLAKAREFNKCVEFFRVMNGYGFDYSWETLNKVVESLCGSKLVVEAKFIVFKLKESIGPNGVTYRCLIEGFCDVGDLIEASKIWNLMVDEGFDPDIGAIEKMMETLFKTNRYGGNWGSSCGVRGNAKEKDRSRLNSTLASLVYGLLARGRVRVAYKIVEGIEKPDINVFHGMIKGLLRTFGKERKGSDPLVNFDTIFVGGLVKAGKSLEATKYVERVIKRGLEVPRFDYNKFLHYYSNIMRKGWGCLRRWGKN